jgi:predicted metalloprotease
MHHLIQVLSIVLQIKRYICLAFFEELKTRFGAQGGFLHCLCCIAHEIGHHVQTFTSDKMRRLQQGKSKAEANKNYLWH